MEFNSSQKMSHQPCLAWKIVWILVHRCSLPSNFFEDTWFVFCSTTGNLYMLKMYSKFTFLENCSIIVLAVEINRKKERLKWGKIWYNFLVATGLNQFPTKYLRNIFFCPSIWSLRSWHFDNYLTIYCTTLSSACLLDHSFFPANVGCSGPNGIYCIWLPAKATLASSECEWLVVIVWWMGVVYDCWRRSNSNSNNGC